jgi:hypothetical protein
MKPNAAPANPIISPLASLPSARLVRHPRVKKMKDETPPAPPPDDETLHRLNEMAKQYPFCVLHRENSNTKLL